MNNDLEAFTPVVDLPLDPGIRRYVQILRAGGIETFESCQGGPGHACPEPIIRFHGNKGAGFRAFAIAVDYGLPVQDLRLSYPITDGWPSGPIWEMSFNRIDADSSEP